MDVLVIGGNRFFGKKLCQRLVAKGHQLTILNRGNHADDLEDVERLVCDRRDREQLIKVTKGRTWDVIYDQVCFDFDEAHMACEVFADKVRKKYIVTSTVSVYDYGSSLREDDFQPRLYAMEEKVSTQTNYGEAKRQMEHAFYQHAGFPFICVRFPVVVGTDDHTNRFAFHIERIQQDRPIYLPNPEAKFSFITSDDAARVLDFLATTKFRGSVNAASPEAIALRDMLDLIEYYVEKKVILSDQGDKDNHSPYGIDNDWYVDCSLLQQLGLVLPPTHSRLRDVIKAYLNY